MATAARCSLLQPVMLAVSATELRGAPATNAVEMRLPGTCAHSDAPGWERKWARAPTTAALSREVMAPPESSQGTARGHSAPTRGFAMHSSASVEASSTETAGWLWLLARWSLLTSLGALAVTLVLLLGVGFNSSVPPDYAELVQASRLPTAYRIAMMFDAIGWLLIGGVLLNFAGLACSHSPMRAAFLAACAIGQLAGSLGGFMRLDGTSVLAAHYASASAAEQAVLQQSYLVLDAVIQSHFHAVNCYREPGSWLRRRSHRALSLFRVGWRSVSPSPA